MNNEEKQEREKWINKLLNPNFEEEEKIKRQERESEHKSIIQAFREIFESDKHIPTTPKHLDTKEEILAKSKSTHYHKNK